MTVWVVDQPELSRCCKPVSAGSHVRRVMLAMIAGNGRPNRGIFNGDSSRLLRSPFA